MYLVRKGVCLLDRSQKNNRHMIQQLSKIKILLLYPVGVNCRSANVMIIYRNISRVCTRIWEHDIA